MKRTPRNPEAQGQGWDAGEKPLWMYAGLIFFWLFLCLLAACLYFGLLQARAGLPLRLTEGSNDVATYQRVGEAILVGEVPYRDFFIEYPPGSLLAFVPPALFTTSRGDYAAFFASEMALVLVVALVLTAYAARTFFGWWWLLSATVFTLGTVSLYPVAVARYDAVVVLALAAVVASVASSSASGRRRKAAASVVAWASLGFGTAVKLVPVLATLPLALLVGRTTEARTLKETARGVTWGFAVFSFVVVIFFLPAFLLGGEGFVESFTYHADRGLQLESLAASALMKLGWLGEVSFQYGAYEVRGQGAGLLSSLSPAITGALLILTGTMMYRKHRQGKLGPEQFPRFAAALLLAFMLGSKVLSPQYVLWLLPLVPLSAGGVWGMMASALFLVICITTTQIFPYHYAELRHLWSPATDILLGRNLLLVALWALMLFLPSEDESAVEPTEG